ncbi:WD40/YVTN/BNR-like repeat-containing protein [Acidovorax sp. 22279]|uniref:WD40/YVTN/BNR-like repeat-containing protein n=1 Tax=Acidovorax sp. 22279 TaxID=3453900 RepID=UPI003F83B068
MKLFTFIAAVVLASGVIAPSVVWSQVNIDPAALLRPASASAALADTAYMAAARVGDRIVAVGERGTIALSDDDGEHWRQAKAVPVSALLTDVKFVDSKTGWAVGHWGTILKTVDGGENWTLQHSDPSVDQPFFSVVFSNASEGVTVGLWSMMLRTQDGGTTWTRVELPVPPGAKRADRNLYCVFAGAPGHLYIAAERGAVLRSTDNGASWEAIETGYPGSLWTGIALKDGDLLVGGLRGSLYRSSDRGSTWRALKTGTTSSITGIVQLPDGTVQAVGLDGVLLTGRENGERFEVQQRSDRTAYTAAVATAKGHGMFFTMRGPAVATR